MAEIIGYEPITTFWTDFSIADVFGLNSIQETYDRAFGEWKDHYEYLTELSMVLNHKIWEWDAFNDDRAGLYDKLWRETDEYARTHLTGDELAYYYQVTD